LKRPADEEDFHNAVETYWEYRIVKKDPRLPKELRALLARTKHYRKKIAQVFTDYYQGDYDIRDNSFYAALRASYLVGSVRLRSLKYTNYLSKHGDRPKRYYTAMDFFLNHFIESFPAEFAEYLTQNRLVQDYLFLKEYEDNEKVHITSLDHRLKRTLDSQLEQLVNGEAFSNLAWQDVRNLQR